MCDFHARTYKACSIFLSALLSVHSSPSRVDSQAQYSTETLAASSVPNMRSILELALPAMVASSLAASNPTLEMAWNTRSAGLTTSLKTVRKTNIGADVPDGLGDYARALARLGSAIPEGLADVLRRRTTGRFRCPCQT